MANSELSGQEGAGVADADLICALLRRRHILALGVSEMAYTTHTEPRIAQAGAWF